MRGQKDKKKGEEELACLEKVGVYLNDGVHVKDGEWAAREVEILNKHLFLTSKPVIYLVNIGKDQYVQKKNVWLPKIAAYLKEKGGAPMIPYSAAFESEVVDADPNDRAV